MKKFIFTFSIMMLFSITMAEVKAQYSDLYLLGSATPADWSISNPSQFKKDISNSNIFTWEGTLTVGELKIPTYKGDWGGDFIVANEQNHPLTTTNYIVSNSIDNKWVVSTEGLYRITVNLTDGTVSFEQITVFSDLYILGSATRAGWSISNPAIMLKDESNLGIFTWEGTLNAGELKISSFKGDWGHGDYIIPPVNGTSFVNTNYIIRRFTTDNKWTLATAGKYRITVNMNNGTVDFTPISYYSKLYLLGNATSVGWSSYSPITMIQSSTDATIYTYQGHLNAGNFRVHAYIGNWWQGDVLVPNTVDNATLVNDGATLGFNINDGISSVPEWNWEIAEGDYLITVNQSAQTIDIRKQYELSGNGDLLSNTNWNSTNLPAQGADITVSSGELTGELTINADIEVNKITLAPGAKITLDNAKTLTATSGIRLQSNASGTATFVNKGTYSGTVTVEQYLGTARNWYVSSPVTYSNSPANNITRYYEYVESGNNDPSGQPTGSTAYWKGLSTGTSMTVGKGYISQASGETTVSFSGTPNNGDITTDFNLTRNDTKGKGFNLVGNPYPSYIDWSLVVGANTNLMSTAWFRTKKTTIAGGGYTFATINITPTQTVEIVENSANTTITKYIPPMQAFWVRVKSGTANTTMSFTNAMREHRLNSGDIMKAPKVSARARLRLQLINGTETDETLLYFDTNATNGYNNYDSPKMMNNSAKTPDLYSMAGADRLVINGLNAVADNLELPLGFSLNAAATLKFKVTQLSNFPEGTKVYLLDKDVPSQTELLPEAEYSFSTSAPTANNESRFSLLFKTPGATTGTVKPESECVSVFVNAQNQIVINANVGTKFAVYNAVGQQIAAGKIINNLPFTINHSKGVYIVKIGNTYTSSIIVK